MTYVIKKLQELSSKESDAVLYQAQLYFDYGDAVLAPMREKVNQGGIKENVHWSSKAMASEACKRDMDEAVLRVLSTAS